MPFSVGAALAAAVVSFVVGGVWYSPLLFAGRWQRLSGVTDEQAQTGLVRVFGGSFALSLVMAVDLAAFVDPGASAGWGAVAGALAGAGWVAPAIGVVYLFERRPLGLILIDGGYHAVSFTLMGLTVGLLQ